MQEDVPSKGSAGQSVFRRHVFRSKQFPHIPGTKYLHGGGRNHPMCSDLCVQGLLVFCAGADQNHPLYLGHLRSGGSQWHQNCIQAALRAADEPSHGLLTASLCAFVQSIKQFLSSASRVTAMDLASVQVELTI